MNTLVDKKLLHKPTDAATVILLRDHKNTLETLLLCRGNSRTVMNSAWAVSYTHLTLPTILLV